MTAAADGVMRRIATCGWPTNIRKAFVDQTVKGFKAAAQARSGEGIAIDVPFKIKSKTFRRIFGGDNIGLRVQGSITIDGKYRQQKFDQLQAANQRNTSNNFNIDMTQRFTIAGKIGEKVQVDVNQDSERLFDFENSLKLTYTGDKDEIIQKVEAGNVSLSLGTNLATFSGQNKGLFGIKTEAKIGALKLTGIASLERGQKNRQKPEQSSRRATWSENDFCRTSISGLRIATRRLTSIRTSDENRVTLLPAVTAKPIALQQPPSTSMPPEDLQLVIHGCLGDDLYKRQSTRCRDERRICGHFAEH